MLLLLMPVFPRLESWVPARGRPDARGCLCPQASIRPLGPASRLGSAVPFLGWLPLLCGACPLLLSLLMSSRVEPTARSIHGASLHPLF